VNFTAVFNNTFEGNLAYYGDKIGSYPGRLELSNSKGIFTTIEVSPGHMTQFNATIYD
jgi:hypothetical protein